MENRCSVRPLEREDVPAIVRYWIDADAADLARMGVDPVKVPSAPALAAALQATCDPQNRQQRSAYLTWLVDAEPIGYSSLKNIELGDRADIHLHIWSPARRGQGHGTVLFAMSAVAFYDRFSLGEIVCEPRAENPMPNRLLAKSGYPLVGTRVGASSELSTICELNTYSIRREIAEAIVRASGSAHV